MINLRDPVPIRWNRVDAWQLYSRVGSSGPAVISIRELRRDDLWNGFPQALDTLRPAGRMGREKAEEVLGVIDTNSDQIVLVADAGERITGTVTLSIVQKSIYDWGHVENLAVQPEFQKKAAGAIRPKCPKWFGARRSWIIQESA